MASIMEREDQDKILDFLNQKGLPFSRYSFIKDNKYGHMKRLGSGGGGSVYAIQSRLGDELAVKIVGFQIPPITDPQVIKDCELEVQTQREVGKSCREIVQIEDAQVLCIKLDDDYNVLEAKELTTIQAEEGCGLFLFILMEKLQPVHTAREGVISKLKSLDENEIIKFAIDIAKALRAAHMHPKKIIHRDVKPDNIFWDELTGVYKLGDFGIAKATQHGEKMTTGSGTGDYRAPEVRAGGSYDIRADIYSYGIMLYKLLNNDWHNMHVYDYEKPLPDPVNGSGGLKQIIFKACAYKPEDRYTSISDLLWDLEQLQANASALAHATQKDTTPLKQEEKAISLTQKKEESNPNTTPSIQLTTKSEPNVVKPSEKPATAAQKAPPAQINLTEGNRSGDAFSGMRKGKPVAAKESPAHSSTSNAPKKDSTDDAFLGMRKGEPKPPISPEKAKKQRTKNLVATVIGSIGLLALLLAFLSAEIIWKTSFLPSLSKWQTYVAISLSVLCTVITFSLKYDFYLPLLTPLFSFVEKKPLWTLVWLLSVGFNLYCFFGLGHNWIFLLIAISLLLGSKGLLLTTNVAAIASILFSALQNSLPIISPSYYWALIILFVVGIRYSLIIMHGYTPWNETRSSFLWLSGKLQFIITFIFIAIGCVIWILSEFTSVNVPLILTQLHILRAAIVYLVISIVERCYYELL